MNEASELKSLLIEGRLTLAAAESLTCGRVQARIGEISGASHFFLGGITAYTLEQKVKLLGVDRAEAERSQCVSAAVAEQMAFGACRLFGADLAVATTGYAEPSPQDGVAEPFAWWAVAHWGADGASVIARRSGRMECAGASRVDVQIRVAEVVLQELVTYLKSLRV